MLISPPETPFKPVVVYDKKISERSWQPDKDLDISIGWSIQASLERLYFEDKLKRQREEQFNNPVPVSSDVPPIKASEIKKEVPPKEKKTKNKLIVFSM